MFEHHASNIFEYHTNFGAYLARRYNDYCSTAGKYAMTPEAWFDNHPNRNNLHRDYREFIAIDKWHRHWTVN